MRAALKAQINKTDRKTAADIEEKFKARNLTDTQWVNGSGGVFISRAERTLRWRERRVRMTWTALPISLFGRFSPLGPRGIAGFQ